MSRRVLLSFMLVALASAPLAAEELGIEAKKPVFGGACKVCPWGAIAEIVRDAMQPYGYDVQICYNCARADAPRIVAAARKPPPRRPFPPILDSDMPEPPDGPVDFGCTSVQNVWHAYQGTHAYAGEPPRDNLRLIATIQAPNYLIVAVQASSGITDLKQIREKRWPVRVIADGNGTAVLNYYGLSTREIEAAGGRVVSGFQPEERTQFDVIIHGGSLGNAPEFNVWYEVSQRFDLKYLRLPDELLDRLAKDNDLVRGRIPNGLLRGINEPIPTVVRTGHAIYARNDTPDDFAYTVAKAMDEQQALLQWSHLNFSYNVRTVWKCFGVPLHPGAERYYREVGYMK